MRFTPFLCACLCLPVFNSYAQKFTEVTYKIYEVNRSVQKDSNMTAMLQPYKDSVFRYMNTVIGFSTTNMYKKQPECALGNFMTDCLKWAATLDFKEKIDAAIINEGSLRSHLAKGDITIQSMYDLMPYNNQLVLLKVNGNVLHQLLDRSAYDGGWPCSGVAMTIKNREATSILINGVPLSDTAIYSLATTDYLAQGSDGCTMLKKIAKQNNNYSYRDALIDYVMFITKSGKPVSATLENRITNADE